MAVDDARDPTASSIHELAVERATESRGGRREERHHELLRHRSIMRWSAAGHVPKGLQTLPDDALVQLGDLKDTLCRTPMILTAQRRARALASKAAVSTTTAALFAATGAARQVITMQAKLLSTAGRSRRHTLTSTPPVATFTAAIRAVCRAPMPSAARRSTNLLVARDVATYFGNQRQNYRRVRRRAGRHGLSLRRLAGDAQILQRGESSPSPAQRIAARSTGGCPSTLADSRCAASRRTEPGRGTA